MSDTAPSMKWLKDLSEDLRAELRRGPFFERIREAGPEDFRPWVPQLYHQSREFTSALAMRYGVCRDPRFQNIFATHTQEEGDHPEHLVTWMRRHGYLGESERPEGHPASLETLAVSAYCFRTLMRDSVPHQVVAMNLISEGVAYDFYTAVVPRLAALGMQTGRYWKVHTTADLDHLEMGLDLLPEATPDSAEGRGYARVAWEMSTLYGRMLDSWALAAETARAKAA